MSKLSLVTVQSGRRHVIRRLKQLGYKAESTGRKEFPHIVVTDKETGRETRVRLKVKGYKFTDWQDNIKTLSRLKRRAVPGDLVVYVALKPKGGEPSFYVWRLIEALDIAIAYFDKVLLTSTGARRPTAGAPHQSMGVDVFGEGLDRWDLFRADQNDN